MGDQLQIGQDAPVFEAIDQEGTTHHSQRYAGKWVVLYFYPKDMTSGCTLESKTFQQERGKFDAADAFIFGVSLDDQASHRQFADQCGLTFPLLVDSDAEMLEAFKVGRAASGNPNRVTVVIDPRGKVAGVLSGITPVEHVEQSLAIVTA